MLYTIYFNIQVSSIYLSLLIIFHHFIILFTSCCIYQETLQPKRKKEKTKSGTWQWHTTFRHLGPAHSVGVTCMQCKKKKKVIPSGQLRADHRVHTESVQGTWAGDAHNIGAGSHHCQNLAIARLLWLLARQGWCSGACQEDVQTHRIEKKK